MPVQAKITYELDGKQVEAKDLDGASGHLVMHVRDQQRHQGSSVDGKSYTICRPYFTVIGTNLSTDAFSNIKAENGQGGI